MIVRDAADRWLLISQVDHAAVSGRIAEHWRRPSLLERLAGPFLFAIAHHDDGWQAWEQRPGIDADGQPRDFMEMPMTDAAEIWSASISVAAQHSRWSGLWVSRHFCHLAQLAEEHRQSPSDRSAARGFLARQASGQQHWRASLGVEADSPTELLGLRGLQFFDRLSLWLCCAEPTAPLEFDDPAGERALLTPMEGRTVLVDSGAFEADELELSAPTVAVPQRAFANAADLHAAIEEGERGVLTWRLAKARGRL